MWTATGWRQWSGSCRYNDYRGLAVEIKSDGTRLVRFSLFIRLCGDLRS